MTFVNASMLVGLIAVGVPVLIHLLRSRQFRPETLGTLRFLRESLRQRRRWNRLENLLLLAARVAIVTLLAFLFARPFRASDIFDPGQPLQVWVALDVSGSMAAELFGEPKSEIAQQRLRQLLRSLPQNAKLTTAVFADQVREWDQQKQPSPPIGGRTDYEALGRWLAAQLRSSRIPDSEPISRRPACRVYIITDLQESGLPTTAWQRLPADVPVEIISIGSGDAWNAAVQHVAAATDTFSRQSLLEVEIGVFAASVDSDEKKPLDAEVFIDRTCIYRQRIAGRSDHLDIPWQPPRPGIHTGQVRILSKDGLSVDNVRPFVVHLNPPVNVLLVNGQPGATRFGDETYFLQAALTTSQREGVPSHFRVTKRERLGDLKGHSVIALCNLRQLSTSEMEQLSRFVRAGGSLIYFLGDQVAEPTYERMHQAGVFPARLSRKEVHVPGRLVNWTTDHPLLGTFRGQSLDGLQRLIFRDTFQLRPTEGAVTLAAFANQESAIIEQAMGDGRIVIFGNPVDRDWQDLPLQRSFVPLIREFFALLGDQATKRPTVLGQVQGLDETRSVGIYKQADQYTIVAADPLESRLASIREAEFRRLLGLPISSDDANLGIDESQLPEKRLRPSEIWRQIAVALLVLLVVENWLADRR